jgi:phospholipid/cholesterol/gamma-HCH transport system ATP-binding protein
MLDLAKTPGIEKKFPAEKSGGMRKRVGLARALIDRPEILLYDEPTTGLDPLSTKNVDEMIQRTSTEFNVTSVVISHDMASTFRIADRVAMLDQGIIVAKGTLAEVMAAANPVLRDFAEASGAVNLSEGPPQREHPEVGDGGLARPVPPPPHPESLPSDFPSHFGR